MNIITKNISDLKPYGNNPKIHTDSQIDKIAKSKAAGNTGQKARHTRARQRQKEYERIGETIF